MCEHCGSMSHYAATGKKETWGRDGAIEGGRGCMDQWGDIFTHFSLNIGTIFSYYQSVCFYVKIIL